MRKKNLLNVVLFMFVILFIMQVKETVHAAEAYYWPVPSVTNLSRGYSSTHNGLDIAAPVGSNIYATKSGTVIGIGNACSCVGAYSNCSHKL